MKTLMTALSIAVASLSLTVLATDANARYKKPLAKPKIELLAVRSRRGDVRRQQL